MRTTLRKEAWTLAIETLSWMEMRKLSERLALARTVKQLGIEDDDSIRVAHKLVCETTKRRNLIDRFVNQTLTSRTIEDLDLGVQAFLRLYVYQTRVVRNWNRLDVKEAASIAGLTRSILGWKTLRPVESVLGCLLTQEPSSVLRGTSDEERVGLLKFHPTWFVKYCFRLFGRKQALHMLGANNRPLPTCIVLNTLKASKEAILEKLKDEGVDTEEVENLSLARRVTGTKASLTQTASHREGLFSIQDKVGVIAATAADPKPGMTVLDVCAAPGAITSCLAQLMQNRGVIHSVDYSGRRMRAWKARIEHLAIDVAEATVADTSRPLPFRIEADIVVLDPPSTSTGAFARLPSARWRLTPLSPRRMAELQWRILNNCAVHVKPKGIMIYTTNSVTVEENEALIERFIKWHPEYSLTEMSQMVGSQGLAGLAKTRRTLPQVDQCNGGFVAKLSKG